MTDTAKFSPETIQAFVAGRLDDQTSQAVREAADRDPELAAELAIWRAARTNHAELVAQSAPSEFGWARIERALGSGSASANDNDASAAPLWSRKTLAPWQAAAAAVVAVLGWQATVVPAITTASVDEPPVYQLASAGTEAEFALRVAFVETASEADMRAALRDIDARIIDGPSAIGLYTLAFADAEALGAGRAALAQNAEVVAEVSDF